MKFNICIFFPLQNAVCFIFLTYLVPILFTFYIQGVLKLYICIFFENMWIKYQFLLKSDMNNGTLHEDQHTSIIIS